MVIELGGLATFIGAIALALKMFDWYLTEEQKRAIHVYVRDSLQSGAITASSMVKAPLAVYSKIIDMALGNNVLSKTALKKSAGLATAILIASASIAGVVADTFTGVSATPWATYDREISRLENAVSASKDNDLRYASRDYREGAEPHYARLNNLISTAKKPIWKVAYIFVSLTTSFLVALGMTMLSIEFSRKVVRELLKTESLLLIISALFLGMAVSTLLFFLAIVILFTLTNGFLLHVSSFASIILTQSALIGAGVTAGYSFLAWYTSPIWIKAVAVGTIVPSLLLIIAGSLSGAIYPVRYWLGSAVIDLVSRAVGSTNGVLAFFATGMALLATAITIAVNIFVT